MLKTNMTETEMCRLCAKSTDKTHAEELFESDRRKLLRQIEELIGRRLKNAKDLPQHICNSCEEQTVQAHAFRENCIRAQEIFAFPNKESIQHKKCKLEEIISPIEEALNKLTSIKDEKEEDDPLTQITEVVIKNEPLNSDDFSVDASDDGFNPLEENVILEPEIKLITTDESMVDEIEYQPEQIQKSTKKIKLVADTHERNFACQQCDKVFNNLNNLKIHMFVHNDKRTFECELCNVSFKRKTHLKAHYCSLTHIKNENKNSKQQLSKDNNWICDHCGRHFVSKGVLDIHLRKHTGDKPFKCEICPESFISNSFLKLHILKHTGELPFPCNFCARRFTTNSLAKRHERTHTNERRFVCQECGKGFTLPEILRAHMVTHTDERSFGCEMCDMSFKLRKHLVNHYKSKMHKNSERKQQIDMM